MEKEVYQKIRRVLPVLAYLLAVYFLAYTTDESIPLVLAGMMPALVNLFVLIFFDPNDKANHVIAFSAPPILGLLFIIIWNAGVSPSVTSMDGPTVAFLNVVLGYIMLVFFIRRGEKVKTKVIIKERPLDDDTQELRERIKEDTEEMSRLRDQIIRYEKALQQSRQASVSEEQIRPLNEMIAQYQYRMQRDAKELENLKRMLAKKQFELETTKYDAQIAEGKLQPLKETITSYQEKVDLDAQELERLRGLVHSYAHELDVTKKEVQVSLRSIEDKCKALNFVIGRVYADKRGGSPEIREKIHIPREMYNEFSEIIQHPKKAEAAKLMKVLRLILAKLEQMELEEGSVFKPKKGRIPLERQKGDPVLAVLARNDNDPVIDYHAEAKLICQKLISIMEG